MGHSLSHGGGRCPSADIPILVGRIGSDNEKVGCAVQTTMAGARRKDRNIPGSDIDFTTSGSAQHESRRTGGKPEHLMRGRMIVMIGINAISPLRRPSVALEKRLKGRSGFFAIVERNYVAIQEDGRALDCSASSRSRQEQRIQVSRMICCFDRALRRRMSPLRQLL